jgi:hypothetical protein
LSVIAVGLALARGLSKSASDKANHTSAGWSGRAVNPKSFARKVPTKRASSDGTAAGVMMGKLV